MRRTAARNARWAAILAILSLGVGTVGFRLLYAPCPPAATDCRPLETTDALLDAAMLLGGMGPVHADRLLTTGAKLFAAAYALYSGLVFLLVAGLILHPLLQHSLHRFHMDTDDD